MESIEIQWIQAHSNLKQALQDTLGCSGQLLKKHLSSKQLTKSVEAGEISRLPLDLVNYREINPSFQGPAAKIIRRSSDYLVLHKPPNLHSHPLCYSDKDTLVNFLASAGEWASIDVNRDHLDRGLLYRLDFETSGVMLVARTQQFFDRFRGNFKELVRRKIYWAVVDGDFDQEGHWTHYFRATGLKGAKQKVDLHPHPDASEGELIVKLLDKRDGKSLLMVNLKTGLRHQIRAQLAALGFPILGDELYGAKSAPRLFLHACRYDWESAVEEDYEAELFDNFFDLDRALQMTHDVLDVLKRR